MQLFVSPTERQLSLLLIRRIKIESDHASILSVIICNTVSRPIREIADDLALYVDLPDRAANKKIIRDLLHAQHLITKNTERLEYVEANMDFVRSSISEDPEHPDRQLLETILEFRSVDPRIIIHGSLKVVQNLENFLLYLKGATSSIKWIMVTTSSQNRVLVETLEAKARQGVEIRLLYASPSLVGALRGLPAQKEAETRLSEWNTIANRSSNITLRTYSSGHIARFGTSIIIDDKRLRMSLHDGKSERSKAGTLIELPPYENRVTNVVWRLTRDFDEYWKNGVGVGIRGSILRLLRRNRTSSIAILMVALFAVYDTYSDVLVPEEHTSIIAAIETIWLSLIAAILMYGVQRK